MRGFRNFGAELLALGAVLFITIDIAQADPNSCVADSSKAVTTCGPIVIAQTATNRLLPGFQTKVLTGNPTYNVEITEDAVPIPASSGGHWSVLAAGSTPNYGGLQADSQGTIGGVVTYVQVNITAGSGTVWLGVGQLGGK